MPYVRLLLIEDREDDAILIAHALRRDGLSPHCDRIGTLEALRAAMRDPQAFDVILCDSRGPKLELESILPMLRAAWPVTPILIVSGRQEFEFLDVIARGDVAGYLSKDRLCDLSAMIAFLKSGPSRDSAPADWVDRAHLR